MKILVTGAGGRLGQAVISDLLSHGHQVLAVDWRLPDRPATDPALSWQLVDLGQLGAVLAALAGCQAVAHLAAIPSPEAVPAEVVFANNSQATFHVLHAAERLGVRRAVVASSLSILGTAWSPVFVTPRYAPVDEVHPLLVADPYGLAKVADEATAAMFHRRSGMQIVALRLAWILDRQEARIVSAEVDRDPARDANVLWAYIDLTDAARAVRFGLEADGRGMEAVNIVAADTLATTPTETLIRRYAPRTEIRQPIHGTASAYSHAKATRLLGWRPEHSWRR